jgi:hypothetical protein
VPQAARKAFRVAETDSGFPPSLKMALLSIAPGFVDTPDEERGLIVAARALPPGWKVEIGGSRETGVFRMTISGNDVAMGYKLFAPTQVADAISWLRSIKPPG